MLEEQDDWELAEGDEVFFIGWKAVWDGNKYGNWMLFGMSQDSEHPVIKMIQENLAESKSKVKSDG